MRLPGIVAAVAAVAVAALSVSLGTAGSTQPDLVVFRDTYLPNLDAAKLVRYRDWERANPAEAARWNAYRDGLLRGEDPAVPSMASPFGRMLIAAGQMAEPETNVPPPVPGTVPASIAADCSRDVTAELQAWLDSQPDGSTLLFPPATCYRVEGGLRLAGRTGLVLSGTGSTLRATSVGDGHRATIRLVDGAGHTIRGFRLEGGYANPGTHDGTVQWSHGIESLGTQGLLVEDVTVLNVGGDCVYLGLGQARTRDATVRRLTCDGTGRNGVSLVAADRTLVELSSTDRIGYVAVDLEPNSGAGFGVDGATIRSNRIGSYWINALTIVGANPVDNVTFTQNEIVTTFGARIQVTGLPRRRNVTLSGNTASGTLAYPQAIRLDNVDGATVTGNQLPTTGVLLRCASVTGLVFAGNTPQTSAGC